MEEMTTELVPITKVNALEIFTTSKLDDYLKAIQDDAENFVGSVETDKGRKQIASKAYGISQEKVRIDKFRKALVAELKELPVKIDKEGKKSRDFLDALAERVREPLTNWEIAEKARKEAEELAKQILEAYEDATKENELFDRQKEIERKEAELKAIEDAKAEKEAKEKAEKERAERELTIAREAKEQAEREAAEKIEAAKRKKIEAETRAKLAQEQAERDKKEALERAEREKKEAIEAAKNKEIARQAEEKRIADEIAKANREDDEKLAKNIAHQRKINREALEDLMKGLPCTTKDIGIKIICLIGKNKIRHITINY